MRTLPLLCLLVTLTSCDRSAGEKRDFDFGRGRSVALHVPNDLKVNHRQGDDVMWLSSGESVLMTVAVFERETAEQAALRHWNLMKRGDPNITGINEIRLTDGQAFVYSTAARGSRFVYAFRTFSDGSTTRCIAVAAFWPLSADGSRRPEFDRMLRGMYAKTAAPAAH